MSKHSLELKHEHPAEVELRDYFLEHWPWFSEPPLPVEYDLPEIREAYYQFGCAEYLAKVGNVVWDALNRLNALDRHDLFWSNTNCRPTVMKVFDYAERKLQEDPNDEVELWVRAVMDSFYGANNFGEKWWIRLTQLGVLEIRWPLSAGLWNEMMLGFGPQLMIDFLSDLGNPAEARPLIENIVAAQNSRLSKWATQVLDANYPSTNIKGN